MRATLGCVMICCLVAVSCTCYVPRSRESRLASAGNAVGVQVSNADDWADGGVLKRLCGAWRRHVGQGEELWLSKGGGRFVDCSGQIRVADEWVRALNPLVLSCSATGEVLVSRDLKLFVRKDADARFNCVYDCMYQPCGQCLGSFVGNGVVCPSGEYDGGLDLSLWGWPKAEPGRTAE